MVIMAPSVNGDGKGEDGENAHRQVRSKLRPRRRLDPGVSSLKTRANRLLMFTSPYVLAGDGACQPSHRMCNQLKRSRDGILRSRSFAEHAGVGQPTTLNSVGWQLRICRECSANALYIIVVWIGHHGSRVHSALHGITRIGYVAAQARGAVLRELRVSRSDAVEQIRELALLLGAEYARWPAAARSAGRARFSAAWRPGLGEHDRADATVRGMRLRRASPRCSRASTTAVM